jgi:hypothetical protein
MKTTKMIRSVDQVDLSRGDKDKSGSSARKIFRAVVHTKSLLTTQTFDFFYMNNANKNHAHYKSIFNRDTRRSHDVRFHENENRQLSGE